MKKLLLLFTAVLLSSTINAQLYGDLDVINTSGANLVITTASNTGASANQIQFRDRHFSTHFGAEGQIQSSITSLRFAASGKADLIFSTSSNNTDNATEKLRIKDNGNIGIGTTNPDQKLTVAGNVNIGGEGNGVLRVRHLEGKDSDSADYQNLYLNYISGEDVFVGNTSSNPSNMFVSGNIGIGTVALDPDSILTVNGKILCEEVEVIQNVLPDYVFEKYYTGSSTLKEDYTMPTLEEVEAFTKKNHHLPEVPSAKEVKENGLQLKEMTTLLLQKIEELTLYTIEQEKRIKSLEAKLANKN